MVQSDWRAVQTYYSNYITKQRQLALTGVEE